MSIKLRLTILNFLELFVFGAWLISLGGYLFGNLHFSGGQIGGIFSTLGLASLVMPAVVGIIADKYLNAQKVEHPAPPPFAPQPPLPPPATTSHSIA